MNLRKKLLDYQLKALVYMIPLTILVLVWAYSIQLLANKIFEVATPFLVASL